MTSASWPILAKGGDSGFYSSIYMERSKYHLAELSIDQLQPDVDNPRGEEEENDPAQLRLLRSIERLGIENPLIVCATKIRDRFIIIDGHRRFASAKKLGMKTAPCRIYPKLHPGELALRRFEAQNNRKEWGPLERAEAFAQIMSTGGFKNDKELAKHLGISKSTVSSSLRTLNQHTHYKELFGHSGLHETHAVEFGRIKELLRDVRDLTTRDIIEILIKKAKHRVIRNAKNFRTIGKIFLKAHHYEEHLYAFLKDPDMTTEELKERTGETWLATMMEKLQQALAQRYSSGKGLSSEEEVHRAALQDFLVEVDPRRAQKVLPQKKKNHKAETTVPAPLAA